MMKYGAVLDVARVRRHRHRGLAGRARCCSERRTAVRTHRQQSAYLAGPASADAAALSPRAGGVPAATSRIAPRFAPRRRPRSPFCAARFLQRQPSRHGALRAVEARHVALTHLPRSPAPSGRHRVLVALTGAGISAESGVPTFRGPDGLWRQLPPGRTSPRRGVRPRPRAGLGVVPVAPRAIRATLAERGAPRAGAARAARGRRSPW